MDGEIARVYGNRLRVRVCGLCWQDDDLLVVRHRALSPNGFWAPPGGGLETGETLENALVREFLEETGLHVRAGRFLFGCEFLHPPLHALELFFEATITGGVLQAGDDPELPLLTDAAFLPVATLAAKAEPDAHGIFRLASTAAEVRQLCGFYRI
ncbi:NUDIX domain-containing protein [Dawidia soli]|uniref:NUDIX hydrolase n=1 Tax=Dawidia soli TaxID=2782352 RepID=A0AAP2D9K4_9BACT|nr:NUDIX hydrolase [Dawidia soli]MBT1687901.1 NUDIX hydrolase [Dawidia soli]